MSELIDNAALASEGAHWYRRDGTPQYTVIGKNGKERNATLKDARALLLVPGLTGVMNGAAKPALITWLVEQGIMSALTIPRIKGESNEQLLARIRADAKEQAAKAAATGTEIHKASELAMQSLGFDPRWQDHVIAINEAMYSELGPQYWKAEHSYAHPSGYGCKLDLIAHNLIVDHKGKDGELTDKVCTIYDEHAMQLAAQREAAGMPEAICYINFFRRDAPGSRLVRVPDDDLQRGWAMFQGLLAYWKAKSRYDSGWTA
jgi:hypothetical protein